MKSWWSEHFGELIAIGAMACAQIWSYARLSFQHLAHGQRIKKVEKDLENHVDAGELHRNPDFERGLEEIRKQIVQANSKLDRLIERRS